MTRKEIKERIKEIEDNCGDFEKAHALEDKLRADFLLGLAKGPLILSEVPGLARLVLSTDKLEFDRPCA